MRDFKAARELLERKASALEDGLANFPVPIYGVKANRLPAMVGTGFLLRIRNITFFVTASHVLDEGRESGLWVTDGTRFHQVAMEVYRTRLDAARGLDFDLAFNELPPALHEALSRHTPVDIERCDPNHVPHRQIIYSFIGYPASLNKPKLNTKQLDATMLPYRVVCLKQTLFDQLQLNSSVHLAMEFDPPNTKYPDGSIRTPPTPKGISGCAVWALGSVAEIDRGVALPKVVGVGIAHRRNPERLEATRIAGVLETIRAIRPDLSPYIPSSRFLGVGVTLH